MYRVCGLFCFLILRALGELVMHRPTSGSFVSYARLIMGERGSFVAGWMFYLNYAMAGIVDLTAVALYMRYWARLRTCRSGFSTLITRGFVGDMNVVAVKWFGEMEFWFANVKVGALLIFLMVGLFFVVTGHAVADRSPGLTLSQHGGIFPHGLLPALSSCKGVVFAYAGIELVGTAAGEAQNARKVLPPPSTA